MAKETAGLRLPLFQILIAAASNVFGAVRKRAARRAARFSYLNPKHP